MDIMAYAVGSQWFPKSLFFRKSSGDIFYKFSCWYGLLFDHQSWVTFLIATFYFKEFSKNNRRIDGFSKDHVVIIPCSMLQISEGDAVILYCKVWWTMSIDVLLTSWIKMSDTSMSCLRSLGPNPKGWKPLFYSSPGALTWHLAIQ